MQIDDSLRLAALGCIGQSAKTQEAFLNESAGLAAFDEIAAASGLFTIYRECWGWYSSAKPGSEASEGKRPRIDRLLTPTNKLVDSGWDKGIIGVEGKAGGLKGGPPISQCLDYSRAIFELPSRCCSLVSPTWIFLWPFGSTGGALGSVMCSHKIGAAAYCAYDDSIAMTSNGVNIIEFDRNGLKRFCKDSRGSKSGSR